MWKKALLAVLVLLVGAAAYVAARMGPRNLIGMLRYDQRKEGTLKVGDRAPDVSLLALDGKTALHLQDSIGGGKPVVLVFGSFT
jgi:hypothetical protein